MIRRPPRFTRTDTRFPCTTLFRSVLTGTPADKAAARAQKVIDIETRIANASRPMSLMRDPRNNYALVESATLGKSYRHLQLDDFLAAPAVTDDAVSLANPALFTELRSEERRVGKEWGRTCRSWGARDH